MTKSVNSTGEKAGGDSTNIGLLVFLLLLRKVVLQVFGGNHGGGERNVDFSFLLVQERYYILRINV